jgi:pyruvate dehydrogenase E1 component alpha subunit
MFRGMLRARLFDERRLRLQRQGRIGTFAPGKGQEASQVGAVAALGEEDWMVPSFRETAASLWLGVPLSGVLLYDAGYNEGGRIPEEIHQLPIAVPVGTQIPHAVGLAHGLRRLAGEGGPGSEDDHGEGENREEGGDGGGGKKGDEREGRADALGATPVVLVFFGDGATSEGDFHESLNLARLLNAPVVFVCQNNQWAISVPRERQTRSKTLAQKALAYGMPGLQVDGNDILAVYAGVAEAVQRAREGDGPTLVECVTYRLSIHTTADDPSRYRTDEEVEEWEAKDPLKRFRTFLQEKGLLDEDAVGAMEEEIQEELEEAWEETKKTMETLQDPGAMFDHLYAELPPYLAEQKEAFQDA